MKVSSLYITAFLLFGAVALSASAQNVTLDATYIVDGNSEKNKEVYRSYVTLESLGMNQSVVMATNGADLILTFIRANKTGGEASSFSDLTLYGTNSAILATNRSSIFLEKCTINVHAPLATGVSSFGPGTVIRVKEGLVNTSRDRSAGAQSLGEGRLEIENATVTTAGNQSPAVVSRISGSLTSALNLRGGTMGIGSPIFSSSGEIEALKCRMESGGSQIASVEGAGKIKISECELASLNYIGFLIYTPDERTDKEKGLLDISDSRIRVKQGPLFYVSNTYAEIYLTANSVSLGSNDLLVASGNDWGVQGSNGGHVKLHASKQRLSGNVLVDSISSVFLKLEKGSSLSGTINNSGNMSAEVRLYIAKGASWTSGDSSWLTSIEFEESVEKGIKSIRSKKDIYYDADDSANLALGGREFKLGGGGILRPIR